MNTEKIEGKFDQVAGKIKQGVGEAVGNQKLANPAPPSRSKAPQRRRGDTPKMQRSTVNDDAHAQSFASKAKT